MASASALFGIVESIKVDANDAFSNLESDSEDNLTECLAELERVAEKVGRAIPGCKLMIEAAKAIEA